MSVVSRKLLTHRSRASRQPPRRPWVTPVVIVVVLAIVVAAVAVFHRSRPVAAGLAGDAVLTASSTAAGHPVRNLVETGPARTTEDGTWRSRNETIGAWVELTWQQAHPLRQVVLMRNALDEPGVTDGFLSFGDGSFLQVKLSTADRTTAITFTPRTVERLRFTASAVGAGARDVALTEIMVGTDPGEDDVATDTVPDGNSAFVATVTGSDGVGASDPHALQDGSGAAGAAGAGSDWTVEQPKGSWVQLDWARPRELTSLELVGSERTAATLSRGTVTFEDGSTLPIGAVQPDPDQPTIVSFMPRVTRSVRLALDGVAGNGALALGELRVYQRGATPVRSESEAPAGLQPAAAEPCTAPPAPAPRSGLVVRCPTTGSVVDVNVPMHISVAYGYTSVTATAWPADRSAPDAEPVRATPDAVGTAALVLDVGELPSGPVTVKVEASAPHRDSSVAYFQLYRRAAGAVADVPSDSAAVGRTLAYAEEFNRPVSLSRNGIGADYAGAKPVHNGDQDFGDAIFPGNGVGFDNVRVVDDRYLRIDALPNPPGYSDPQNWGRTHLGGIVASARQGGSGFSAQYGYFESRMLAPGAPGTWPAFWTLPSDNLVAPTPVEAEFDAIELYGHDPKYGCASTHAHKERKDAGGIAQCAQRFDSDRAAFAWHTYGVSITPSTLIFYIDGKIVATAPQVEGGGSPMFFLVDLALGGGWPIALQAVQDRATLYVDYIRVYV
jgi:hypothetical protein